VENGKLSAQACWTRGFGKYKYCGLREEPLTSTELPKFSLANLDNLLLPEMSDDVREKLEELSRRVEDLTVLQKKGPGQGGHRTDLMTLLRYLRAQKYNVKEAEKQLRDSARWRVEMDIDRVFTHWDLEAYERCLAPWWLSGGLVGHGKNGEPVAIERIGHCHFPNLLKAVPFEVMMRMDIVHCQRCVAALEEDAIRKSVALKPCIVIMDLQGYGWDQCSFEAARKLAKLVESRNLLLTETTGKVLMINAPPAFTRAWAMFNYLLDPGTRAKVEVVSGYKNSKEVMQKYIPDNQIPEFYGGKRRIHGDKECSMLLAPGGFPPQEALDKLLRLATRDGAVLPSAWGPDRGSSEDQFPRRRKHRMSSCCGW
jgi:hypothetical protein